MLETDEEAGAVPEVRILVNKVAMKNGTCNEDSTDINDSLYLQWFFLNTPSLLYCQLWLAKYFISAMARYPVIATHMAVG